MKIGGIVVPIVTPLTEAGLLDSSGLSKLVAYLISGGVQGIFVAGTTGEFPRLTEELRWEAYRVTVAAVAGRVPVYAGISDASLEATQKHTAAAQLLGVDFLVVSLPYYFPITEPEEAEHYLAGIATNCEKPLLLYNIPGNVGSVIPLETVRSLASHPAVAGIKDSGSDLVYFKELLAISQRNPAFKVLVGNEAMLAEALPLGAHGAVPSLGNVFPSLFAQLWQAAQGGNWQEVNRLCAEIAEINKLNALCQGPSLGHIRWKKHALSLLNICQPATSKPYLPLTEEQKSEVASRIQKYREANFN